MNKYLSAFVICLLIVGPVAAQSGMTVTVPPDVIYTTPTSGGGGISVFEIILAMLSGGGLVLLGGGGVIVALLRLIKNTPLISMLEHEYDSKISEAGKETIRESLGVLNEITDGIPAADKTVTGLTLDPQKAKNLTPEEFAAFQSLLAKYNAVG